MYVKKNLMLWAAAIALALPLLFVGNAFAAIDGGYVGTAICATCHAPQAADHAKSGHPYKVRFTKGLTPVASGGDNIATITDPLSALLTPKLPLLTALYNPNNELNVKNAGSNLDWSAVSYVIGGFGWKARWGVKDTVDNTATGFIWSSSAGSTSGTGAQFNMLAADLTADPSDLRSDYSSYGSATKTYSCAICHNTNGTSSTDANCSTALGSGRTEPWASTGLTSAAPGGFRSEWTFSGVQCEACHGAGDAHATAPSTTNITKNTSKALCAKCHIRSTNTASPVYGGECGGDAAAAILTNGAPNNGGTSLANQSVQHHEQYNELVGYNGDGAHASLECVTCHDPHKRSHKVTDAIAGALGILDNGASAEARGAIKKSCTSCHYGKTTSTTYNSATIHAGLACIDCHMAETTKSATLAAGTWGAKGDVKGHIFRINPTATTMDRTNAGGKHIATNYITVNYACGKCHDSGAGGTAPALADASAATAVATAYHPTLAGIDGGYMGSAVCGSCHTSQKADFDKSGHPYKVRFTKGLTPVASGGDDITTINDPLSLLLTPKLPLLTALYNPNNESNVKNAGSNLDWSAVSYVIGGFGWKARWGVKDTVDNTATGFIWSSSAGSTSGTGAQFNMLAADLTADPSDLRSDYSSYGSATKSYSCAICHNTNGTSSTDAGCITALGSGRTEPWASTGLTSAAPGGFKSEWTFSGVQCEACHGAGAAHVTDAKATNITKNTSKDLCAKCHIRSTNISGYGGECGGNSDGAILTHGAPNNGGTSIASQSVQHHEQYNELVGYAGDGVHANLECVSCHNPHKRSHKVTDAIAGALQITDNNQTAEQRGAVVSCENCHGSKAMLYQHTGVKCIDCHMAETTKSATQLTGSWGSKADVKGHIFRIDPSASTMDRINESGKHIATNYITVNYACGKCHDAAVGTATVLTEAEAKLKAVGMHPAPTTVLCTDPTNAAPVASHTIAQAGNVVTLTDTSTDNVAIPAGKVTVSWGDGTTSTGNQNGVFVHTYATMTKKYTIKHSVTDAGVQGLRLDAATNTCVPLTVINTPLTNPVTYSSTPVMIDVKMDSAPLDAIAVTPVLYNYAVTVVSGATGTIPVNGATIALRVNGKHTKILRKGTNGTTTFSVPAGNYSVQAWAPGYKATRLPVLSTQLISISSNATGTVNLMQ